MLLWGDPMRIHKIERKFDVLEKFAEESGVEYTGKVASFAMKIKRHLHDQMRVRAATYTEANTTAKAAVDDILDIIDRLA